MATSTAMDQFDESKKPIAAFLRVTNVAKTFKHDNSPCKIDECLFLGSVGAAANKDALKNLNVTHILTVAGTLAPAHPDDFVYKIIDVVDRDKSNIKQYFDECFDFIDQAKRLGGGVLVHCFVGRSRSVTIVVAYLMKTLGMSLSQALEHVKSRRPQAAPIPGFIRQLEDFEKSLQESHNAVVAGASIGEILAKIQKMDVVTSDPDWHARCFQLMMLKPASEMFVALESFEQNKLNWLMFAGLQHITLFHS